MDWLKVRHPVLSFVLNLNLYRFREMFLSGTAVCYKMTFTSFTFLLCFAAFLLRDGWESKVQWWKTSLFLWQTKFRDGWRKKKEKRRYLWETHATGSAEVSQFCLTDSFLLIHFMTWLHWQNKQNNNEDDCWDSGKEWEDKRLTERWRWRGEEKHCN